MRNSVLDFQIRSNEAALKKIAAGVRVYLAREYDEHYDGEVIERAVGEWFAREVENLLADGVELLTVPRHGHAFTLRHRLDELDDCGREVTRRVSHCQAA